MLGAHKINLHFHIPVFNRPWILGDYERTYDFFLHAHDDLMFPMENGISFVPEHRLRGAERRLPPEGNGTRDPFCPPRCPSPSKTTAII